MIYVLEGHALKHAVEEMLLHLVPAEIPAEAETVPEQDRKSTRLNSSHSQQSRMPSSA